jgi:hypothetical protein
LKIFAVISAAAAAAAAAAADAVIRYGYKQKPNDF